MSFASDFAKLIPKDGFGERPYLSINDREFLKLLKAHADEISRALYQSDAMERFRKLVEHMQFSARAFNPLDPHQMLAYIARRNIVLEAGIVESSVPTPLGGMKT